MMSRSQTAYANTDRPMDTTNKVIQCDLIMIIVIFKIYSVNNKESKQSHWKMTSQFT